MSVIYDDFLPYRDPEGLNQGTIPNGQTGISQNGALFTAQYLICLLASPLATDLEKYKETERVVEALLALQSSPGCSVRFKGCGSYDSMDNTTALVSISGLYGEGEYPTEMYEHGSNISAKTWDTTQDSANNKEFYIISRILALGFYPRFFWNNQNPNLFCMQGWFWRSPAMMGLIKMTSGKYIINPFNWISVLVGQFLGCTSVATNTDARTLSYVAWQFLKKRSWIWKLAYKAWCWQLMRVYPNGMKDVYKIYFSETHPIVKYSNKY